MVCNKEIYNKECEILRLTNISYYITTLGTHIQFMAHVLALDSLTREFKVVISLKEAIPLFKVPLIGADATV